jgi:hypothetical protein
VPANGRCLRGAEGCRPRAARPQEDGAPPRRLFLRRTRRTASSRSGRSTASS